MNTYLPLFTSLPASRQDRWDRLAQFAAFWHGTQCGGLDIAEARQSAEARLGFELPVSLLEWHTKFGRSFRLWSDRAVTLPIELLHMDNGVLILRTEAVFNGMLQAKWGIPVDSLQNDDPEVYSILGDTCYECAKSVSEFAIYCAIYDTVNSRHFEGVECDNDVPFPIDGTRTQFPDSFGIIKAMVHEGPNWIALTSGDDWYLRRRDGQTGEETLVKHEVRS